MHTQRVHDFIVWTIRNSRAHAAYRRTAQPSNSKLSEKLLGKKIPPLTVALLIYGRLPKVLADTSARCLGVLQQCSFLMLSVSLILILSLLESSSSKDGNAFATCVLPLSRGFRDNQINPVKFMFPRFTTLFCMALMVLCCCRVQMCI